MPIHHLLILGFILSACSGTMTPKEETKKYFGVRKGCFLLYNMKTTRFEKVLGGEVCEERLPPMSSFKIPIAIMAFDSGLLRDEQQMLKWDGKKDEREVVNQDHNAITFMRDSVVWFSQRITTKLGEKKFQDYLNKFEYGNKEIRPSLTTAWLANPGSDTPALRISAYEQVEFMKRLWTNTLPVGQRAMDLTKKITYLETSPKGFKLNGKTGSNFYDKARRMHFGWFISHLERGDQEYIAVINMSDVIPSDEEGYGGAKAKAILKRILEDSGLW